MVENKAMADLDPDKDRDAKWDAIDKMIRDKMGDEYQQTIDNYDNIRELLGSRLMREIHHK